MLGLACWSHGGGGGVDVGQAGGVVNYHSDQASFATNFKIVGGGDNCQCVRDALLDQNTCFFIKFINGH